jgi:membrane-associated phospholipid phosphatase
MKHIHTPWRRRLLIGATFVLVLVIGFSRMYLGVHYMSDVAGGYLAGTVWLMVCIAGNEFVELRLPQNSRPEKIRNPKQTT